MSKFTSVIVIVLSLIAGFGGGFVSQLIFGQSTSSKTPTNVEESTTSSAAPAATSTTSDSTKTQTLEECLTEVWGTDKYAAISANSSLATTEDNLAALKCYN